MNDIIFYETPNGQIKIEVFYQEETFWLSQKKMAELFDVSIATINEHLQNIFKSNELTQEATIRKFRIVQREGNRDVNREIDFYNLDAIIAVGYRVNSGCRVHKHNVAPKLFEMQRCMTLRLYTITLPE